MSDWKEAVAKLRQKPEPVPAAQVQKPKRTVSDAVRLFKDLGTLKDTTDDTPTAR